jgi:hypothetical protein
MRVEKTIYDIYDELELVEKDIETYNQKQLELVDTYCNSLQFSFY